MPWRDRLLPASFRDAAFFVESHTATEGGRRVQVHEYPGRDVPYAEDLGRVTPAWDLQGYLVGDAYARERDALVAACAAPGPGRLVHPYLGEREATCTACEVTESTREGRMARVRLRFVAAGANRYPAARADTATAVSGAADAALAGARADLAGSW